MINRNIMDPSKLRVNKTEHDFRSKDIKKCSKTMSKNVYAKTLKTAALTGLSDHNKDS